MKKIISAICFAALLLTACSVSSTAQNVSISETSAEAAETSSDALPEDETDLIEEETDLTESVTETESTDEETEILVEEEEEEIEEIETEPEIIPEIEEDEEYEVPPIIEEEEEIEEFVSETGDYKSLYKAKLERVYDKYPQSAAFDLFDLDNDGTPELCLSVCCAHVDGVYVYTVKDCRLVELGCSGSYGEAMICNDGYFWGNYSGNAGIADYFYYYDGEKFESVLTTDYYEGPGEDGSANIYCSINEEKATLEEYNAALSKYKNNYNWVTVGRGNTVDPETINSVLS